MYLRLQLKNIMNIFWVEDFFLLFYFPEYFLIFPGLSVLSRSGSEQNFSIYTGSNVELSRSSENNNFCFGNFSLENNLFTYFNSI